MLDCRGPNMLGTIGILTGGGDAPGLNAVIRAVVKTATCEHGMRVIGIEDGFEGLLGATRTRLLSPGDVRGLLPRGGTILGTRNRGNFVERVEDGVKRDVESVYQEAITNMKILGIDALVVLGGEGTLTIAAEFHKRGICVCGVPKTIDNDLACTELTFGFVTALDIATEALDRLHTTAESHDRVMILEVMGRHAGWIALHSGIAGGADVILIPEIPFSLEAVADKIRARDISGSNFSIIVVAEGADGDRARARFIKTRVMDIMHPGSVASVNTCNKIWKKLPAGKLVASCSDISSEAAVRTLSTACWQPILDRVQCAHLRTAKAVLWLLCRQATS